MQRELTNILITGSEQYDKRKYRDDFGSKPNTFRKVVFVTVTFSNGSMLDLTLKFSVSSPSKDVVELKAKKLLIAVGLLPEETEDNDQT